MQRLRLSYIFLGLFILNNAAWLIYVKSPTPSTPQEQERSQPHPSPQNDTNPFISLAQKQLSRAESTPSDATTTLATQPEPLDSQFEEESSAPPELNDMATDLPPEISNEFLLERAFNKETFNYEDNETKIAIVDELTPHGDELTLLQNILDSNESVEVKLKVIDRFKNQSSYGAINTMLKMTESDNSLITKEALTALASAKDTSVIPTLKQKAEESDDAQLKQAFQETITTLQQQLTMSMDNNRQ